MEPKSLALAINHIYPSLVPLVDFHVTLENGVQEIVAWNNSNPQPTQDQLDAAWFEVLKNMKKAELTEQCSTAIQGGFTSNALGVSHTYPSIITAQIYWNATLHRFQVDSTFTTVNQKTLDAGYLAHTKDQYIQAFNDGHEYGIQQDAHLADLISKVDALTYSTDPTTQAQNETALENITW